MGYLKLMPGKADVELVKLNKLNRVLIPSSEKDCNGTGGYTINFNYADTDDYILTFAKEEWNKVNTVINQLHQVINPNLLRTFA